MARKIINRSSPGTADIFGADDLNMVNRLLTGTDQSSPDAVDINTTWKFRNSRLQIANAANTFKTTFANLTTTDKSVTLPSLAADDTFVFANHAQTLTGKTIAYGSNTLTDVAGTTASQTLTNKTMDAGSNTFKRLLQTPDVTPRLGGWFGGDNDTHEGIYQGGSRGTITGTEDITHNFTAADGRYTNFSVNSAGTAAANNNSGHSMGSEGVGKLLRSWPFRFKCKFRMQNMPTNARFYCGLKATSGIPANSDTPLGGTSGFYIFYSTGVSTTNFYLEHNDGSTNAIRDTIGTRDASIRTIEIIGDSTNMRYSLDGASFVNVTSQIPAPTTTLYPVVWLYALSTTAKSFDMWYWYVESDA